MAQSEKFTPREINYCKQYFGDCMGFTSAGNIIISKNALNGADTRLNTVQYALHRTKTGVVYIRRMITSPYEHTLGIKPKYYVLNRDPKKDIYHGYIDACDAVNFLVRYLTKLNRC